MVTIPAHNVFRFDLSEILRYPIEIIVEGWSSARPLHWVSTSEGETVAEGNFLESPGLPLLDLRDDDSCYLRNNIPEPVLNICANATSLEFEVAQACAISGAAYELAMDTPLLFILLVSTCKQQGTGIDLFLALVGLKRRDILTYIGLPASNSLARIIKRLALRKMTPWELDDVIAVLCDDAAIKLLRHHPNIHLNHLTFIRKFPGTLWPGSLNLVEADSGLQSINWACRLIADVERLSADNQKTLRQINSRQGLQDLHDRLVERFNANNSEDSEVFRRAKARALEKEHGPYPAPPVPESTRIQALKSWSALLDEGRTMHHCVGAYDIMVAAEEVFIYKMEEPERLTIALENKSGNWVLGEIRGYCNANPESTALELIHRWLKASGSA